MRVCARLSRYWFRPAVLHPLPDAYACAITHACELGEKGGHRMGWQAAQKDARTRAARSTDGEGRVEAANVRETYVVHRRHRQQHMARRRRRRELTDKTKKKWIRYRHPGAALLSRIRARERATACMTRLLGNPSFFFAFTLRYGERRKKIESDKGAVR